MQQVHESDQALDTAMRLRRAEMRDVVLAQYTMCARVLNEIFALCPESDWQEDGIGSCRWEGRQDDIIGGLLNDWWKLRHDIRHSRIPIEPVRHPACWYHKPDVGCVLGDLKAPKCLGYVSSDKLPESFEALGNIRIFLEGILHGRVFEQNAEGCWGDPEANWPAVREFVQKAEVALADAKKSYLETHDYLPLPVLR